MRPPRTAPRPRFAGSLGLRPTPAVNEIKRRSLPQPKGAKDLCRSGGGLNGVAGAGARAPRCQGREKGVEALRWTGFRISVLSTWFGRSMWLSPCAKHRPHPWFFPIKVIACSNVISSLGLCRSSSRQRHLGRTAASSSQLVTCPSDSFEVLSATEAATATGLEKALKNLKDPKWQMREPAARALGAMGKEAAPAIPELIEAFKDSNTWVCKAAAWALGAIGREVPELVLPRLREALKDSKKNVRIGAADALGEMRKEAAPAIPELQKALNDPDQGVCFAAEKALGAMGIEAAPAEEVAVPQAEQDTGPVKEEGKEQAQVKPEKDQEAAPEQEAAVPKDRELPWGPLEPDKPKEAVPQAEEEESKREEVMRNQSKEAEEVPVPTWMPENEAKPEGPEEEVPWGAGPEKARGPTGGKEAVPAKDEGNEDESVRTGWIARVVMLVGVAAVAAFAGRFLYKDPTFCRIGFWIGETLSEPDAKRDD